MNTRLNWLLGLLVLCGVVFAADYYRRPSFVAGYGAPPASGDLGDIYVNWKSNAIFIKTNGPDQVGGFGMTGGTISVQEQDGDPFIAAISGFKFPNGSLTDNGDGTASVSVGGGGGGDNGFINGTALNDFNLTNSTTFFWTLDTATDPDTVKGFPTNLANAQIAAAAAIDATKIANGTVDNTEFQLLNGMTSLGPAVSDTAWASSWNGVTTIPGSKNAIYDWGHTFDTDDNGLPNKLDLSTAGFVRVSTLGVVSSVELSGAVATSGNGVTTLQPGISAANVADGSVDNTEFQLLNGMTSLSPAPSDTAFAASWNGVTTIPASKNAVYDALHLFDTDDDGKVNVLDQVAGIANTDASGVIQTPITTSAGFFSAISDESGLLGVVPRFSLTSPAQGDLVYFNGTSWVNLAHGVSGQFLETFGASANPAWGSPSGSGDFSGPGAATDNAIVRFDGTTGKLGQNSGVIIDDSNNITGVAALTTTTLNVTTINTGSGSARGTLALGDDDNSLNITFAATNVMATNIFTIWPTAPYPGLLFANLGSATNWIINATNSLAGLNTILGSTLFNDSRTITIAGTANEITSSAGAQDMSANRTWTLSLPSALTFTGKTVTGGTFATPTISGAIVFPDGVRQTFNPDSTTPGLNVGAQAGDPSTPSNGDLWYDSTGNLLRARVNGASITVSPGGSGTVTASGGSLTANAVVLGAGSTDTKVSTGLTTDGAGQLTLGVAGSVVGSLVAKNGTSGAITVSPPTGALGSVAVTWPNASSTLPIFGQQVTFTGPTAARSYALPDSNVTLAQTVSPSFTTPTLGVATATTVNKWTFTAPTTGATLTAGADNLTYTGPSTSQTLVGVTSTDTLQNKTVRTTGNGGNNVLKWNDYDKWVCPQLADESGAIITTNNAASELNGHATFSGSGATNANWVVYEWVVPDDIDTSVDLKVARFKFTTAGTSTSSATFNIGMQDMADSADQLTISLANFSNWVAMTTGTLTSPVASDGFTISATTLTSWKSSLTAGHTVHIMISRDGAGDANNDALTDKFLSIQYGRTQ